MRNQHKAYSFASRSQIRPQPLLSDKKAIISAGCTEHANIDGPQSDLVHELPNICSKFFDGRTFVELAELIPDTTDAFMIKALIPCRFFSRFRWQIWVSTLAWCIQLSGTHTEAQPHLIRTHQLQESNVCDCCGAIRCEHWLALTFYRTESQGGHAPFVIRSARVRHGVSQGRGEGLSVPAE